MPQILVVDDEPAVVQLVRRTLEKVAGYSVTAAPTAADARDKLAEGQFDVAIIDVLLPDESGLNLMTSVQQIDAKLPVVFVTGGGTAGTAIEAMEAGAFDYLAKPLNVVRLRELVQHAVEVRRLMTEPVGVAHSAEEVEDSSGELLVGRSPAMTEVYKSIGRVASKNVTVLVRGESGTGKELVARSLYQHSNRADKPFLAVNCAAIPEPLLESELFGHEKGAFTGADQRRIGKFEQCSGGTLFLDEIGDMPLALQSKILRLLQDQRFERVGGNETIQTDVRIITATHRDLEAMSEAGRFRGDLYYRLNVFEIIIPPLRERSEDLPLLAVHFLRRASRELEKNVSRISGASMDALRGYDWPGNIRELRNAVESMVALDVDGTLGVDDLPESIAELARRDDGQEPLIDMAGADALIGRPLKEVEKYYIQSALELTNGKREEAASILGIGERTLYRKITEYGLKDLPKSS